MNPCTIIITSYNYKKYLEQCIESALNQTVKCDVIVHDDASTDNSQELLQKYREKASVFFWVLNNGIVQLRNYAAQRVTTEWIVMLDADDYLDENYVEKCLEVSSPELGIIYPRYVNFISDILPWSQYGEVEKPEYDESLGASIQGLIYGSSMFRKQAWDDVGGYSDMTDFEDYDLFLRISEFTDWKIKRADARLNYRKHVGSRSTSIDEDVAYMDAESCRIRCGCN